MKAAIHPASPHRQALFQADSEDSTFKAATAAIAFLEADLANARNWDLTTRVLVGDLEREAEGPLRMRLQKILKLVPQLFSNRRTAELQLSLIREPLLKAYNTHRTGSHPLRIDQELVAKLHLEYDTLATAHADKPESEIFRDACTLVCTIEDWQSRRREGLIAVRARQEDLALEDAEDMLDELVHFPALVDTLLNDKATFDRFCRLVVRDHLPVSIFADWPEETDFLEKAEGLHCSITGVGHTISVGVSGFPEILVSGRLTRIRDLPGYKEVLAGPRFISSYTGSTPDTRFRNLQGYCTLGCDAAKGNYFPYSRAAEQADLLYPNGYFYTAAKGLIQWNPRTWSYRTETGWQSIDLENPDWLYDIPPIRSVWVDVAGPRDEPLFYEPNVEASETGPQTAGIHGYYALYTPARGNPADYLMCINGQWKRLVDVRTFGTFATPFEAGARAVNPFFGEVFALEQNHAEPSRHNVAARFPVSKEYMNKLIAFTKQERLQSLSEMAAHEQKERSFIARFTSTLGSIERAAYATFAILAIPTSVYLGVAFAAAAISTLTFACTLAATLTVAIACLILLKVRSAAPSIEAGFHLDTRNCTSALKRSANVAGISLPTTAQAHKVLPRSLRILRKLLNPCSPSLVTHPYITKIFLAMQDDLHKNRKSPPLYTKSTCSC